MKLILKIERRRTGAGSDFTRENLDGETISIGRGAGAQIRFRDPQLAPIQAIFEINTEGLLIREIGRSGLIAVNGSRVQAATLQIGDELVVGTHHMLVGQSEGVWSLTIDQASFQDRLDDQEIVKSQLERLSINEKLPSLLSLSLSVLVLFSFCYFLIPVVTENKEAWSSGPISSAHKFIESDCQACHIEPFKPVRDAECSKCHNVANHAPSLKETRHQSAFAEQRCADCHQEHNGKDGLHSRDSRSCVSCHADLKKIFATTHISDVLDFSKHPEFRITAAKRVALGSVDAIDNTPLKLNHALHLENSIRGPKGLVTLQCSDCHAVNPRTQEIEPISFEKNCRSCHSLEFDPRFPGVEVPHGDQARISEFLSSHYSKLLLQPQEQAKVAELNRIKPGMKSEAQIYNRATLQLLEDTVEHAEDVLYRKTGCQLCHLNADQKNSTTNLGAFEVQAPNIPSTWLPHAKFSHQPHLSIKCQDCHGEALKSKNTEDILLPKIDSCHACHADPGVNGKLDSACVECHSYH